MRIDMTVCLLMLFLLQLTVGCCSAWALKATGDAAAALQLCAARPEAWARELQLQLGQQGNDYSNQPRVMLELAEQTNDSTQIAAAVFETLAQEPAAALSAVLTGGVGAAESAAVADAASSLSSHHQPEVCVLVAKAAEQESRAKARSLLVKACHMHPQSAVCWQALAMVELKAEEATLTPESFSSLSSWVSAGTPLAQAEAQATRLWCAALCKKPSVSALEHQRNIARVVHSCPLMCQHLL